MRVGIVVKCNKCSRMKQPVGRYAPTVADYCDSECLGYWKDPAPGQLWPGETEKDFGYKVGSEGTKEIEDNEGSD